MNKRLTIALALAGLVGGGLVAGQTLAAEADADREPSALDGAKVTLIQAITTAEQQTGGHAYDAGVNASGGKTRIVVETNGPKGVQTVVIDAQSGQLVDVHAGGEPD